MWPEAARLRPAEPLNLVFDGNSLVYGIGAAGPGGAMPAQAVALLRRRFADLVWANKGLGGQSWRAMDGYAGENGDGAADVDGAYVPGRTNVLVAWETTNAVVSYGRSVADTVADARAYVTHRLQARPGWRILLLSTLPRQVSSGTMSDQATVDGLNAALLQADAGIAAGCRAWGARGIVDVRAPGSPFRFPDFAAARFAANDPLWNEPAGGRIHLTDAGYAIVAGLVAGAVRHLAAR